MVRIVMKLTLLVKLMVAGTQQIFFVNVRTLLSRSLYVFLYFLQQPSPRNISVYIDILCPEVASKSHADALLNFDDRQVHRNITLTYHCHYGYAFEIRPQKNFTTDCVFQANSTILTEYEPVESECIREYAQF